mgnify:CR=1 FL=1
MKQQLPYTPGPIGVFDSGYGGLTILNKIREILPEYDYIYEDELLENSCAKYLKDKWQLTADDHDTAGNK